LNQQIIETADEYDRQYSSQKVSIEVNKQEMSIFKAQLSKEQQKYSALFTEYETVEKNCQSLSM
jgi:hypothetical protein